MADETGVVAGAAVVVVMHTTVALAGGSARRCDYVRNPAGLRNEHGPTTIHFARGTAHRTGLMGITRARNVQFPEQSRDKGGGQGRARAARAVRFGAPVFSSNRSTCFST